MLVKSMYSLRFVAHESKANIVATYQSSRSLLDARTSKVNTKAVESPIDFDEPCP